MLVSKWLLLNIFFVKYRMIYLKRIKSWLPTLMSTKYEHFFLKLWKLLLFWYFCFFVFLYSSPQIDLFLPLWKILKQIKLSSVLRNTVEKSCFLKLSCYSLDHAVLCLVTQSCLTLCHPLDRSQLGSSVHGDSPGKNTGVNCHALLQRIFPTQGLNPGLRHCRQILYHLNHQGNPRILEWVAYPFSRGSSCPRNWTGISCIASGSFTSWSTREAHSLGSCGFFD